jgi:hypothetical protein
MGVSRMGVWALVGRGSRTSLDGAQGDSACRIYGSQRRSVCRAAAHDVQSTVEQA